MNKELEQKYVEMLRKELIPAMGCTEPIAIAYASAVAAKMLGSVPTKLTARCSGNIIKNVKGVVVPNSNDHKGIAIAAILGAIGGDSDKRLEVLSTVTEEHIKTAHQLEEEQICSVELIEGVDNLDIIIIAENNSDSVLVEVRNAHTNIVRIEKNGENCMAEYEENSVVQKAGYPFLTLEGIFDFAQNVEIDLIKDILDRQISYNMTIAEEGLNNDYGAKVGQILLERNESNVRVKAKAYAAAGSDARMSGCDLPVVINSGSGNQGMTVSLPVIIFAKHLQVADEKLYRALLISNLIAIYQKQFIGKLSAYCGAVSAATGCGAGITYLYDGTPKQIQDTITNTIANVSGIICDGAKASCAAKIASAVDAAILAHQLAMHDISFDPGDGIVKSDLEKTIHTIGKIAAEGMKETDVEILKEMIAD